MAQARAQQKQSSYQAKYVVQEDFTLKGVGSVLSFAEVFSLQDARVSIFLSEKNFPGFEDYSKARNNPQLKERQVLKHIVDRLAHAIRANETVRNLYLSVNPVLKYNAAELTEILQPLIEAIRSNRILEKVTIHMGSSSEVVLFVAPLLAVDNRIYWETSMLDNAGAFTDREFEQLVTVVAKVNVESFKWPDPLTPERKAQLTQAVIQKKSVREIRYFTPFVFDLAPRLGMNTQGYQEPRLTNICDAIPELQCIVQARDVADLHYLRSFATHRPVKVEVSGSLTMSANLLKLIAEGLVELDLGEDATVDFEATGSTGLVKIFQHNTRLTKLSLNSNPVVPIDVTELFEALRKNTTLQSLNITTVVDVDAWLQSFVWTVEFTTHSWMKALVNLLTENRTLTDIQLTIKTSNTFNIDVFAINLALTNAINASLTEEEKKAFPDGFLDCIETREDEGFLSIHIRQKERELFKKQSTQSEVAISLMLGFFQTRANSELRKHAVKTGLPAKIVPLAGQGECPSIQELAHFADRLFAKRIESEEMKAGEQSTVRFRRSMVVSGK